MPEIAFIGLGANLGAREQSIAEAVRRIDELPATRVKRRSSLWETAPVGKTDQPSFVNAVAEVETDLSPQDLLDHLLAVETAMGRARRERWGPRVIDLDLLLHGDTVVETEKLTLPHPRMAERHFVLAPLVELAPDLLDPLTRRPWKDILADLPIIDWGHPLSADHA
jgi:2-amino-4-hydroxy-6-hydroxymethyldihydropteridine diphosphokinase